MIHRRSRLALGAALVLAPGWAIADGLTLTDMTGRSVTLSRPAERVVTIPIPSASTVIALTGGPERLVGMHPLARSAIEEGVLGEFFPGARDIAANISESSSEGFAPNVETIAALTPDIVVQWGDQGDDLVAPLENAGLATGLILYGNEEKARGIIRFLGEATGESAKVVDLIAWRDATMAAIQDKLAGLADAERPSVLYLLRATSELRANGNGTYNDFYIELAGGRNAADELDGIKPVNREQIAAWNPDVILINTFERDVDLSAVYGDPILSHTKAAQSRRVYKLPTGGYRWDPPSQESPFTWMWLSELLHPDRVDFPIRAEIKTRYRSLYGQVPTDAQIDDILRMTMNGDSAGYQRFAAD